MPGCSDIIKKLRDFPVKDTAITFAFDAAVNTVLGCAASAMGAETLGLDEGTAAKIGAVGGLVFGASRSLAYSTYKHFTKKDETPPNPASSHNTFGRNVYNFYHNQFVKQGMMESEATPLTEQNALLPVNHASMAREGILLAGKYVSYAVLENMLGYFLLNKPPEFSLQETATSGATGSAELEGIVLFIAFVAYSAPYLSNKFIEGTDACLDAISCESPRPR